MHPRAAWWSLVPLLGACFDPTYTDATRCGAGVECPPGRSCQGGQCRLGGATIDAPPADIDASPPDAAAPFSVSVADDARVVRAKSPLLLAVTVTRSPGFTDPVTLMLRNLPGGVSASTTTISANSATIAVTAAATAALGDANVTVRASAGTLSLDFPFVLSVVDPPGTPDKTFDGGQVLLAPLGAVDYTPDGLAVRPGGGVVVVTSQILTDHLQLAIVDLGVGGLPTTFGQGGTVMGTDFGPVAIAVQADGSVVALGSTNGNGTALRRWTPTGQQDVQFGGVTGGTIVRIAGMSPIGMGVQPGGAIVYLDIGALTGQPEVCRLTSEGKPDSAFANGHGCWSAATPQLMVTALSVGTRGLILVGGTTKDTTFYTAAVDPDGANGFEAAYAKAGFMDQGYAVAGSGAPIVVGTRVVSTSFIGALARTFGAGPDPAFGGGVVARSLGAGGTVLSAAATQADGKIIVAGYVRGGTTGNSSGVCARFTTTGTLDTTFGANGVVLLDGTDQVTHVRIADDGRIVLAGHGVDQKLYVGRLWP